MSWAHGFGPSDEGRGPDKLGYLANDIGSSIGFCFPAPDAGEKAERGAQRTALWVGYLRSYEHMGRASLGCSGRCRCRADVIDAHETKRSVSVTDVRRVELVWTPRRKVTAVDVGGCGSCTLTMTVLSNSSSGEHKFKVMSFLIETGGLSTFSLRASLND